MPKVKDKKRILKAGEEKEQEIGKLFEKKMTQNFPNLVKEIDTQVLGAQRIPTR